MECASPVEVSHRRMLLTSEPEARILLSGDYESVLMPARWPSRVCWSAPLGKAQILTVQSALAEAMARPLGENLTHEMAFLWPWRTSVGA